MFGTLSVWCLLGKSPRFFVGPVILTFLTLYSQVGSSETSGEAVQCVKCPVGASCDVGGCAFDLNQYPSMICPGQGPVVGEWQVQDDGSYMLISCPETYALVNSSNGTGVGTFAAEKQQCLKCDGYLVDPVKYPCQECPPGEPDPAQ